MANKKNGMIPTKIQSNECSNKANSFIYNRFSSSKGDYTVYKKVSISNNNNSLVMKQQDFVDFAHKIAEDGRARFLVQEHKEANPKYNTTAVPAIGVTATLYDNNTILFDIKESLPGRALEPKKSDKGYMLIIEEDIFFKYYDVLKNDIEISEYLDKQKKASRFLELDDEF